MKRIVVLFPYFGILPPQYRMWRASALYNTSIDFMFFTDANIKPAKNIIVHKMQFHEFKNIVQKAFDFPITLDRPYKICEYRPAFAYILKQYIEGYDFWGWGDLDLVYGDIRSFINDDVLSRYKMISGWGHFSLYHNDNDTNTYFMSNTQGYQFYKEAFTEHDSTFFDEFLHKGFGDKWMECRPNDCWLEWPFDNVSKPKQSYHFISLNREWEQVLFEHIGSKLFMIKFQNGELIKKESLYAHFQHRPFMKDKVKDYSHFLITPNSIIDYPQRLTTLRLKYYSRTRNLTTKYYQWRDRLLWKLNLSYYK